MMAVGSSSMHTSIRNLTLAWGPTTGLHFHPVAKWKGKSAGKRCPVSGSEEAAGMPCDVQQVLQLWRTRRSGCSDLRTRGVRGIAFRLPVLEAEDFRNCECPSQASDQ